MALQRLRRDDTVVVIAGRERGKTGKVLRVLPVRNRVVVEQINVVKRHQKPRSQQAPGGIIEKEAWLDGSNVQPVCGRCGKPTRIGHRKLEDGRTVRVCRRCNELLEGA
jgi:large subunit ribosomal protein L24